MMPRLSPILPINADETLTSYVSRLAHLNKVPNAFEFCKDFGFSFKNLCYGRDNVVARLADLTGEPFSVLKHAALTHTEDNWLIRGERFCWKSLRRSSIAYCPACLQADSAQKQNQGAYAYERIAWSLDAFRTCPHHGIALEIQTVPGGIESFRDFARCTAQLPEDIDRRITAAEPRPANPLERYISRRLQGDPSGEMVFDGMPLTAVVHVCEAFGAALLWGPSSSFHTLSPNEKAAAGGAGFAKLCRGREGTLEILDQIRKDYLSKGFAVGRPSVIYKNLYGWLYRAKDPVYASFKKDAVEFILGHSTSHLRGSLFGDKIPERAWHSIRSAHVEFGIDPNRLRSVMAASGLIAADTLDLPNSHVIVPAEDLKELVGDVLECVGWDGLTKILGVPRSTVANFVGPGRIEPLVPRGTQPLKSDLFRRSDIQKFVDRLMRNAVIVDAPTPQMCGLLTARRRTVSRVGDIVGLILDGHLRWIGRRNDVDGIPGLLIDVPELKLALNPDRRTAITFKKAASLLRIHPDAVHALIKNGYIQAKYIGIPERRSATRLIPLASITHFQATYLTSYQISRRTGLGYTKIRKAAAELGISPVGDFCDLKLYMYHADDALRLIGYIDDFVKTPEQHPVSRR